MVDKVIDIFVPLNVLRHSQKNRFVESTLFMSLALL